MREVYVILARMLCRETSFQGTLQRENILWLGDISYILYCKTLYICATFILLIGNFEKFAPLIFANLWMGIFFRYDCRNISHTYIYLIALNFIFANSIHSWNSQILRGTKTLQGFTIWDEWKPDILSGHWGVPWRLVFLYIIAWMQF